jgi:hypothetical protein
MYVNFYVHLFSTLKMIKRIIFLVLLASPLIGTSQKQGNVWYFGRHAGLDFNTTIPTPLNNGKTYSPDGTSVEGSTSISDSAGNLLFYSNGMKIWNKNHQIMPNGDSILGNFSSTQSAVVVPKPGSSRYFYLFTVDDFYEDGLKYGFRYSVVDMFLDNCNGDVIPNLKNIHLLGTVSEKLTAIRHSNGSDYWIIVHKYYSDAFYSYHLSSTGIVDSVVSHNGSRHPNLTSFQGPGAAIGQMKVSPNGKKIAIVNGNTNPCVAEYFDFNNSTGLVSNCVSIQTNPIYNYYGVSFSPDNSKLYISCTLNNNGVYQFDMNAGGGNPDSVKASRKQIVANGGYFGLQLGVDGKLYLAKTQSLYLSLINNPNNYGASCNYLNNAIYLNGDTSNFGLPSLITNFDYSNSAFGCSTGIKKEDQISEITIYPNPCSVYTTVNYKISDGTQRGELILIDVLGKEIKKIKIDINSTHLLLSTSDLPSGTYFFKVQTENNIYIGKKLLVIK